jgi:LCP family protein required for cell wall assembly
MTSTRAPRRSATVAVLLSFIWPGLGQAYQRRYRAALVYAVPIAVVLGWAALEAVTRGLQGIALDLFDPAYAQTVLILGLIVGAWRLVAMIDALLFARRAGGRVALATGALVVLGVAVVGGHGYLGYLTWSFYDAGSRIFVGGGGGDVPIPTADLDGSPVAGSASSPTPSPTIAVATPAETPETASSRITVLLTGIDSSPTRRHALTDTLLVVSADPAARTGVMASIPRDLARFPLWSGGTFSGKINSLLTYAQRNPREFPDGPTTSLVKEVGYLLGVPVHYYAAVNLEGFVELIDLVGGVTVTNERAISDPAYGGWTDGRPVGFYLGKGRHRLDGQEALAYVRSRKGVGDNDFTRARRQQQLLLALQKKMTDPAMLPKLPAVLAAAGDTIKTNFPASRLSEMLDLAAEIDEGDVKRIVLGPPYARNPGNGGGYILVPDMEKFAEASIRLFGEDSRYHEDDAGSATPAP